jgi:hypothetical protein
MASILKVDDLRGNTAAGNITITSEGGAATMQLQQGVVKQWINMDGSGTISTRDSLNNSSLTDNGTGNYTVRHTNNFSSVNYAPVIGTGNTGARAYPDLADSGTVAAANYGIISSNASGTLIDARICTGQGAGDLA